MKRKIINIDEEKCTGCGQCIPDCPEGALMLIDGKARLVSDLFCDGLGACMGTCPEGAITVIEREAGAYDEKAVMANIVPQGPAVIAAHLEHLLQTWGDGSLQPGGRISERAPGSDPKPPGSRVSTGSRTSGSSLLCRLPGICREEYSPEPSVPDTRNNPGKPHQN